MLLKNISAQWTRTLFVIIVGFILPRFMNQYLGTELYGVWQSLIALTGIIQLLALGVPMATVRFISQYVAKKDYAQLQKIVSCPCFLVFSLSIYLILFMLNSSPVVQFVP